MWSQADAMEDMTVVSEIGLQWSPKIAPASTEEIAPSRMPSVPVGSKATAEATAGGTRIDIVAQEVPVAKAVAAERQEFGIKWMWFTIIGQFVIAWLMAFIVFQGGKLLLG